MSGLGRLKTGLGRAWPWLKWVIAIALLSWLVYANRHELSQLRHRRIDPGVYLLAALSAGFGISMTFVRWYVLARALDFPLTLLEALRLGALGLMGNYVGPGGVSGDVIKVVSLARRAPDRRLHAMATILYDRVLGLVSLLFVGALAMLLPTSIVWTPKLELVARVMMGAAAVGLVALLVLHGPWLHESRFLNWWLTRPLIGKPLAGVWKAATLFRSRPRTILEGLALSIFGHLGVLTSFWLCAEAIEAGRDLPDLAAHWQFVPVAELFGVVIPTPGGVGALEGAISYFYGLTADPTNAAHVRELQAEGLLVGIANRAINVSLAGLGLLFYLSGRRRSGVAEESDTLTVP